ncbi:MAG: hypothetical protein K2W94_06105 [Alphaproteobacteria bacterium]|nr:hypothetical protein [Alphaproteobacteria bacterium]
MSVIKRSHSLSDFRHRVVLIHRKIIVNCDEEIEEIDQEISSVWAKIEPLSSFTSDSLDHWHSLKTEKIDGMFKITMRNSDNRIARHAYLNAIRWNHKILDILIPFQIYENGKWIEGIAVECRRESKNG